MQDKLTLLLWGPLLNSDGNASVAARVMDHLQAEKHCQNCWCRGHTQAPGLTTPLAARNCNKTSWGRTCACAACAQRARPGSRAPPQWRWARCAPAPTSQTPCLVAPLQAQPLAISFGAAPLAHARHMASCTPLLRPDCLHIGTSLTECIYATPTCIEGQAFGKAMLRAAPEVHPSFVHQTATAAVQTRPCGASGPVAHVEGE